MSLTATQLEELAKPLDARRVKKKPTGFRADYIEGWWAIAEANRIFGADHWHREMVDLRFVGQEQRGEKWKVGYLARVKITVTGPEDKEDIIREGTGFGNGEGSSLVDAHELAAKEAETDAMKRALSTFGWPFGLALYDKDREHVDNSDDAETKRKKAAAATGIDDAKSDLAGTKDTPSPQATRLGDNLKACGTLDELRNTWAANEKVIRALHIVDRRYLDGIKNARKEALQKATMEGQFAP